MQVSKEIRLKVIIRETAVPPDPDGKLMYNAQILTSVDGGETFAYCGQGRFCRTRQEAREYAAGITDAVIVLE